MNTTSTKTNVASNKIEQVSNNNDTNPEQVPLRFVTAASLFDGHDASINIMRRILQSLGVEVRALHSVLIKVGT